MSKAGLDPENLCQQCKENLGEPSHGCPFEEEINDDSEKLCNCCESCEESCMDAI